MLKLADDQLCFGCGAKNPRGLHLKFTVDEKRRTIRTQWTPTKEFQGYADIVHGGMTTLVLDETMGNLLWKLGRPSVSAEIAVRFLHPAKVGESLQIEAEILSEKDRVTRMRGVAKSAEGKIVATADAAYIYVRH